jgi:hypothetical protein
MIGNLFGTTLDFFRTFSRWDGWIIFSLLGFFEIIGKLVYKKPPEFQTWIKITSCFKTGILLGLFIDGFKVGS